MVSKRPDAEPPAGDDVSLDFDSNEHHFFDRGANGDSDNPALRDVRRDENEDLYGDGRIPFREKLGNAAMDSIVAISDVVKKCRNALGGLKLPSLPNIRMPHLFRKQRYSGPQPRINFLSGRNSAAYRAKPRSFDRDLRKLHLARRLILASAGAFAIATAGAAGMAVHNYVNQSSAEKSEQPGFTLRCKIDKYTYLEYCLGPHTQENPVFQVSSKTTDSPAKFTFTADGEKYNCVDIENAAGKKDWVDWKCE